MEERILKVLGEEKTMYEIAKETGLSWGTVRYYLNVLLHKGKVKAESRGEFTKKRIIWSKVN